MRSRLFLAPWWVQALVPGTFFGALVAILAALADEHSWLSAVISGTISGSLAGALMGWWAVRERDRWRTSAGDSLSDAELRLVHRATSKGSVPSDPRLRMAAVHAATYSLAKRADQNQGVALLAIFLLISLKALDSLWWLTAVPVFVYAAYETWAEPRRLRARIELLTREPDRHPI